jgi:ribosomal protein L24
MKRKSAKKITMLLAASMCINILPAMTVNAGYGNDEEWSNLKAKIGQYDANWTDGNLKNAVSQRMIETALMGNGDVGVNSAGNEKEKSYLISKQDFWNCGNMNTDNIGNADARRVSPLSVGGLTVREKKEKIKEETPTVNGCGYLRDVWDFDLAGIIDGSKEDGDGTTWACKGKDHADNPREHWFEIDLKTVKTLSGYRIYHNASSNGELITSDFTVQVSKDGKEYELVETKVNNQQGVTEVLFESPKDVQYIRVDITKANSGRNDGVARILEMEWIETEKSSVKVTGCGAIEPYDLGGIIDGKMERDGDTWACNHKEDGGKHWYQIDFGEMRTLKKYILYHQGAFSANEGAAMNTVDFEVFVSADGINYESVQKVEGNTENQTEFVFAEAKDVQYVKVEITKANTGKDTTGREAEMRFWDENSVDIITGEKDYDFNETLSIADGTLQTDMEIKNSPVSLKNWVSATDNVMITEVTSKGDTPIEMEGCLWVRTDVEEFPLNSGADDGKVWASKKSANLVEGQNEKSWTSEVVLKSKILGKNPETVKDSNGEASMIFTLNPGKTVQIVTAVGGGGQTYDWQGNMQEQNPFEEADEILARYTDKDDLAELKIDNDNWWKDYWLKSYIDIADEQLHRYYYGSLYYMACTSRGDKLPSGLYGIWTTTDGAMWNGDYHMNYNYIAPFYGMYSSNRYEHAKSLKDPLLDFMDEGKRRAKTNLGNVYNDYIYGGNQPAENGTVWNNGKFDGRPELQAGIDDAILYPVALGPWGSYTWGGTDGGYLAQAYDAGFPAMAMTAYYNYTKDGEYLKEVYPFLLANANFYEKWCEKEIHEDGTYRYNVWNGAHEGTFDMNSGTTIGVVKNILECLIDGTEDGVLNPPEEKLAIWKDMYENFAEYPIEVGYEPLGYTKPVIPLSEVGAKFRAGEANVGLEFIAPGQQLGFDSDPEIREAARNSIELKEIGNPNIWSQINETPKLYLYSIRSGVPAEYVIDKFKTLLDSSFKENYVIQDGYHGIEKAGAVEFINTMLLQSDKRIIKVFPNWIGEDASFTRLRERGAFLVSSEMKDGNVTQIQVISEAGEDATFVKPWENAEVVDSLGNVIPIKEGKTQNTGEETLTFETEKNETYRIYEKTEDPINPVNKDTLDKLIKEAEKIDLKKYTEKSGKILQDALDKAKEIFTDEGATEEEVKNAERVLKDAMKNLVEKKDSENNNGGNNNGENNTGTDKSEGTDSPKTGDNNNVMGLLVLILATFGCMIFGIKRQQEEK